MAHNSLHRRQDSVLGRLGPARTGDILRAKGHSLHCRSIPLCFLRSELPARTPPSPWQHKQAIWCDSIREQRTAHLPFSPSVNLSAKASSMATTSVAVRRSCAKDSRSIIGKISTREPVNCARHRGQPRFQCWCESNSLQRTLPSVMLNISPSPKVVLQAKRPRLSTFMCHSASGVVRLSEKTMLLYFALIR